MDPWVWLAAYLVGFTLLQLLLYRYFRRDVPRSETTTPASVEATPSRPPAIDDASGEGELTCQRCGTINEREPSYTFCRQCLSPLR